LLFEICGAYLLLKKLVFEILRGAEFFQSRMFRNFKSNADIFQLRLLDEETISSLKP